MDYGLCKKCNQENTYHNWCKACNAKRFQQNFENWTSGNVDIDKFIQDTQLSADNRFKILEWIPYDRFYDAFAVLTIRQFVESPPGVIRMICQSDDFVTHSLNPPIPAMIIPNKPKLIPK